MLESSTFRLFFKPSSWLSFGSIHSSMVKYVDELVLSQMLMCRWGVRKWGGIISRREIEFAFNKRPYRLFWFCSRVYSIRSYHLWLVLFRLEKWLVQLVHCQSVIYFDGQRESKTEGWWVLVVKAVLRTGSRSGTSIQADYEPILLAIHLWLSAFPQRLVWFLFIDDFIFGNSTSAPLSIAAWCVVKLQIAS